MSRSHNKKRNVGIIYEQIVNFICKKLLEENNKEAKKAIRIVKKHFKSDTQLYKEYKLFKALVTTNSVTDQLASSIISEAKKACNYMFDEDILEKEKSMLIKDLNYNLGKGVIFEEKIDNYRQYATIQTLLNEWRNNTNDFDKLTEYEIQLHSLLTEKSKTKKSNIINENLKFDPLTYKLMKKKFNEKYTSLLNKEQNLLIEVYTSDNTKSLEEIYLNLKNNCVEVLKKYINNCNNKILLEKVDNIIETIYNLDTKDTSKENLKKFLTISKLKEEVLED